MWVAAAWFAEPLVRSNTGEEGNKPPEVAWRNPEPVAAVVVEAWRKFELPAAAAAPWLLRTVAVGLGTVVAIAFALPEEEAEFSLESATDWKWDTVGQDRPESRSFVVNNQAVVVHSAAVRVGAIVAV